jgi:hypothetical protein
VVGNPVRFLLEYVARPIDGELGLDLWPGGEAHQRSIARELLKPGPRMPRMRGCDRSRQTGHAPRRPPQ